MHVQLDVKDVANGRTLYKGGLGAAVNNSMHIAKDCTGAPLHQQPCQGATALLLHCLRELQHCEGGLHRRDCFCLPAAASMLLCGHGSNTQGIVIASMHVLHIECCGMLCYVAYWLALCCQQLTHCVLARCVHCAGQLQLFICAP